MAGGCGGGELGQVPLTQNRQWRISLVSAARITEKGWVRGGGIFIYFFHVHAPTPPAPFLCPAAEIHLNTIQFSSSPMWSRKDGDLKDPTSLFQNWKTSGTWYIKKVSRTKIASRILRCSIVYNIILSHNVWRWYFVVWSLVSPITNIYELDLLYFQIFWSVQQIPCFH